MHASIRDLRAKTKLIMSTVERGESVIITTRGHECAKIVPIKPSNKIENNDDIFGMWRDYEETKDVKAYINKIREGRKIC